MTVVKMPGRGSRRPRATIVDTARDPARDPKVIDFFPRAPAARSMPPLPPRVVQRPIGPQAHEHPYVSDTAKRNTDDRFARRVALLILLVLVAAIARCTR